MGNPVIFSEVYSAYFNTLAAVITEAISGKITEKRILEIINEEAFSESMLTILPAIKKEEWLVMNRDFLTPIQREPAMPLTLLQKRWLKGLLSDPRIRLFKPDIFGLKDVEPLFTQDDFVFFDRYNDGDHYTDITYIRNFQTILSGLKEKRRLLITYKNRNDKVNHGRFIPYQLEYSPKDDKFRLVTAAGRYALYINLARIIECELLDAFTEQEINPPRRLERSVSFTITDQRHALDRIMLHFSDCRKETRMIDEFHYDVTLWYESHDETEVLIRILSFGPMIQVTEPENFIRLIKERICMQIKLLE